jgi:hypothetical protein
MKVLPFILKQKQASLSMTNLCLFLSHGGRSFWQTEESTLSQQELEHEYLLPNGLIPKKIFSANNLFYVWIDAEKTKLDDFYTWEEAYKHPEKPECWRSFYFFEDASGSPWFSPNASQVEAEIEGKCVQIYYEDILRLSKE